jgi:NTP pyrophosphatase (non-canonical NTP hydrolase)
VRGLSRRFLKAMRQKLQHGRRQGYRGWDQHWENCTFHTPPTGYKGFLMTRLREEVAELTVAVEKGNLDAVRSEAADVANLAMFVADIEGALE